MLVKPGRQEMQTQQKAAKPQLLRYSEQMGPTLPR
jgi:hypothetical protein